jgi:Protein of unknown function, DUF481
MNKFSLRTRFHFLFRNGISLSAITLLCAMVCGAQTTPAIAAKTDVLGLSNGDTLHGKLVNEVGGKVSFHSDALGDLTVSWDKIKELHTADKFAVLDKTVKMQGKKNSGQVPVGPVDMENQAVTVRSEAGTVTTPIPVKDAQYIVDEPTLIKDMNHEPGFRSGWNGAATAGATLVTATQNQYTFTGAVGVARAVPTVAWMNPRNRTSADFTGSYGKITQPAYRAAGVIVPATITKSAIYHADAERDQYFSPRLYALVQTAFDHNFAQDLELQQIYGAGIGWTVLRTSKQEADLKATMQYEKQQFISGAAGTNQNLIGSTFAATYLLHTKLVTLTQALSFIPSYNTPRDYSANETDTFAFPAYRNFSFSMGTIDTYLNNSPATLPPTLRNSFQFTMGLTYAIKSKY